MNKKFYIIALSLMLIGFSYQVIAQDEMTTIQESESVIEVKTPYAFATISNAPTGAVFFDLINNGDEEDTLIAASSDVAQINEIHENYIDEDDGTMMMRKIPAIVVGAKSTVNLKPTGKHIMLIRLKEQLRLEDEFDLTLNFEKSGAQVVSVKVIPPGTQPMSSLKETGDKLKEMIMTIDKGDAVEKAPMNHSHHMDHNKIFSDALELKSEEVMNADAVDTESNTVHYE